MKNFNKILGFLLFALVLLFVGCDSFINDSGDFDFTVNIDDSVKVYCNYAEFSLEKNGVVLPGYESVDVDLEDDSLSISNFDGKALKEGTYKVSCVFFADEDKKFGTCSLENEFEIIAGGNVKADFIVNEENFTDVTVGYWGKKVAENSQNIHYVLTSDKRLYLFGEGDMYECDSNQSVVAEECYISDGITSISAYSFYKTGIKRVHGADSVTSIEKDAFKDCKLEVIDGFNALTSISDKTIFGNTFSKIVSIKGLNSVESIGAWGFDSCTGLKTIEGFNSLKDMGKGAFNKNGNLESIKGFNAVTEIGEMAFNYCSNLKTVSGFENVTSIGESAFAYCTSLDNLPKFNKLTTIKHAAFKHCTSLKDVSCFDNVTTLEQYAICECTGLEDIIGFNNLESMQHNSFQDCENIKHIKGFNKIEEIPENAFPSVFIETIEGFENVKSIGSQAIYHTNGVLKNFQAFYYYGTENDFNAITFGAWETKKIFQSRIHYMKEKN